MTIERTFQGAWKISELDDDGYLVTRQYMDYTKSEAKRMFREEMKERNK